MPLKVFISYRRQDTAATAVGISQYLENEFGRKNVYVDVDMQAGAKYPAVIEKRLAECRVLLVLIGPDRLKLQKPKDWVQREIAYALKRDITVIPVLINGAQLPDQELLPDDLKGLLDHQAASVSLAGFRHEMAGLVRDIRSIRTPKPWRLLGAIAAALILSVTAGVFVHVFGFYNLLERIRPLKSSPGLVTTTQNAIWNSRPGEWIMYAFDQAPVAYFIKPSSLKVFGDSVAYTARYPLHSTVSGAASSQGTGQGTYEDMTQVLDCKKSVFVMTERTVYNSAGEIIFHFKSSEPEPSDLSNGQTISSGTILALAERLLCDEKLRALLLSTTRFNNIHLSYLGNSPYGGNIFYGPVKKTTSNPTYPFEVLLVAKENDDHDLADAFPGQSVRGRPSSYRIFAETVQINCADKKILVPALEYYDRDENLVYLAVQLQPTLNVAKGSYFDVLLNIACGPLALNVAGNYDGMNYISYGTKGQAEQKVSVTIQQNGSDLKVSFQTPDGASGEGTGKLAGNRAESISLHSTTPGCPGSYDGWLSFADNSTSWSYKGDDCGGSMEGHGTATKVTQ
jgi:TIR domain-containing protein